MLNFNFSNSYANLPPIFYSEVKPTPVKEPKLIQFNQHLAKELNLEITSLSPSEAAKIFSGNLLDDTAKPLAQAYAGHQFGHFNPQLGDGRAILLGDVIDQNNIQRDIQLKGSGPTPYSRSGDGRAAIGPVIREYILSEAMHKLGVKTTRALAAVTTGEAVYRQTLQPGAIITRVASSHVRIGTFEYFQAQGNTAAIKQLADFVIQRHYPDAHHHENPYLQLLKEVINAQALLVSSWMQLGFIHGVMNTDNMSVCGETIDYGPCAFMDSFHRDTVFSSIDKGGRYAYNNQGSIALWNLTRFAECLLPLIDDNMKLAINKAETILNEYPKIYQNYWLNGMLAKIGITKVKTEDSSLLNNLLEGMEAHKVDFTVFFRNLSTLLEAPETEESLLNDWIKQWKSRLQEEPLITTDIAAKMNTVNPIYIPRNHLVEAAISAAEENANFEPMGELMEVLSKPFTTQKNRAHYSVPPAQENTNYQTFCGT